MTMVFNRYAQFYDSFYRTKDYKKECAYLQKLFKRYYRGAPKTVLDLGCGTGNHMLPFLKKGYDVTGVDSSKSMLSIAKAKVAKVASPNRLKWAKIHSFRSKKKFDVVLCMFSVIDYITQPKTLTVTLKNIARHMHSRSLFIFDFWQDSAVTGYYTPRKSKVYRLNGRSLERSSKSKIDPSKKICEVHYTCTVREKGHVRQTFHEKHRMRYFAIDEITDFLDQAGLELLNIHPFMSMDGKIRRNSWDLTIVAQKKLHKK